MDSIALPQAQRLLPITIIIYSNPTNIYFKSVFKLLHNSICRFIRGFSLVNNHCTLVQLHRSRCLILIPENIKLQSSLWLFVIQMAAKQHFVSQKAYPAILLISSTLLLTADNLSTNLNHIYYVSIFVLTDRLAYINILIKTS